MSVSSTISTGAKPEAILLKLRAADSEDMQVISAVLQDSIAPVCDMAYQAESKNFVMVVQRLRRELGDAGAAERICSALTIGGITAVQTQGIDLTKQDQMLDLLAIMIEGAVLNLIFAGEARIRLDLSGWAATLEDFREPWPVLCNPCHDKA
jgi:hypothetical protein